MVLPLYLALTPAEMGACAAPPTHLAWMACHFSPDSPGLGDLPGALPEGAMLILNDRLPCRDHDPQQVAAALAEAVRRLKCGSVLLDFERKPEPQALAVANALFCALPCPVAAPPGFAKDPGQPVFLPPCPLQIPLAEYLAPWQGREIWLEAALQRRTITVTPGGTTYGPTAPADRQAGGWFDDILHCQYRTEITADAARFTLFDTPESLKKKLTHAAQLGVTKAVGLYQELGFKL